MRGQVCRNNEKGTCKFDHPDEKKKSKKSVSFKDHKGDKKKKKKSKKH